MPTGYTSAIKDGISFEDFVLCCARAFGACITMRDDAPNKPIPEKLVPSSYHKSELAKIQKELADIAGASIEWCEEQSQKEYAVIKAAYEKDIAEAVALQEKYKNMRKQVMAWTPPTDDHKELKEFMIEQITGSIGFDCNCRYQKEGLTKLKLLSGEEWRAKRLAELHENLAYHTKENAEEIARTEGRNLWLKQLRESLSAQSV